jgi:hypothetical protein
MVSRETGRSTLLLFLFFLGDVAVAVDAVATEEEAREQARSKRRREKKSKQKLVVQADVCANTGKREEEIEKDGEDACSIYPTGQWRFEHLIRLDHLPYLPHHSVPRIEY